MPKEYILEYWIDDQWYVGQLREMPAVFSQGKTLEELEENIRDAYRLVVEEQTSKRRNVRSKPITVEV